MKRRILALLIIILLAVFTFGLRLATSPRVDRWLEGVIVEQMEKYLGIKVTIGGFERNLFMTRVTFSEVTLEGLEGGGEPVFLSRLALEIDSFAFLRGTLNLKNIFIEGLSLDVVRKGDGEILVRPLPPFRLDVKRGVGKGIPFRLEIGKVSLMGAKVSFLDEAYGLALNTGDITIALTRGRFISADSMDIALRTGPVKVRWKGLKEDSPLEFNSLQASLLYGRENLDFENVRLSGESVNLELTGRVPLEENGQFAGEVDLSVDLGRVPLPWEGISGRVTLEGSVEGDPSNPTLTGRMGGQNLQIAGRSLENVEAGITLNSGGCFLENANFQYRNEPIEGDFYLGFSNVLPYRLTAASRGFPVEKVLGEIPGADLPLEGRLSARISASGDLTGGNSDLAASGGLDLSLSKQEEPVSFGFQISGLYRPSSLEDLFLSVQSETLDILVNGSVAKEGPDLMISGRETDLARWKILSEEGGIVGSAEVRGDIRGGWKDLRASLDAVFQEPGMGVFSVRAGKGHLDIDRSGVSLKAVSLETGSTTFLGKGHFPWRGKSENPWFVVEVVDGTAQDLQAAAGFDPVVEGKLSGRLEGAVGASGLAADFLVSLKGGSVFEEDFEGFEAKGTFRENVLDVGEYRIEKNEGLVRGHGKISGGKFEVQFNSVDPVSLEGVATLRKIKVPLAGPVEIEGSADGRLDGGDLEIQAGLVWEQITYDGRSWGGGDAQFRILDGTLTAAAALLDGVFSAQARVGLREDFPFSGTIRTTETADREAVNDLIGVRIPQEAVSGNVNAQAKATGMLANIRKTIVQGTLRSDDLTINGIRFRSRGEVPFSYYPEAGIRFMDATLISGESVIAGNLLIEPGAAIEGNIEGTVDLQGISFLRPTVDRFSGLAAVQLQVSGRLSDPVLSGSIGLQDARCSAFIPFELPVRNLEGDLEIVGNRLRSRGITGTSEGGTIRMEGDLLLERFKPVEGEMSWKADSVPIRFPKGLYTINRANLTMRFSQGRGVLRGTVTAEQGRFSREVDIENLLALIGERMAGPEESASEEGFSGNGDWLVLDVGLETASPIEVDIKLLKGTATGDLHLQGTAARPILAGRVEFIEGTIVYRGHVFDVVSGSIGFFNPARIEPAFDFSARTEITGLDREGTVTDYVVELVATGVPEKFKLDLLSYPALSEIDIISLLTWGAVGEQAFATRAGLSSAEAALLLTRQLRGSLETGVQELTGFDRVIINPSAVTSTGERTTRVQLDKRLSDSFFLTYSTPVLTSEEQEVLLKYRVSDSFSLIGQQKGEEDFGFDLDFQFQIP